MAWRRRTAAWIVKTTAALVPFGVVIVMFFAPSVAPGAMAKSAVTVVALDTTRFDTVIPDPALIAVAPVRFVPVRVTGTVVPTTPVDGETLVSVGVGDAATLSSATAAHDHACPVADVVPGVIDVGVAMK